MRGSLGFDSDIQEDDMKGSETYLVVGACTEYKLVCEIRTD